jgi:acyl-CoA synthetase (AMP-forming)/AMP-acid ligase II
MMRNLGYNLATTGKAIIEAYTGKVYTYEDLNDMCNSDAHMLIQRGLKLNDRIAIAAENSARYISLFYGAMRIGVGVVTIDNSLTVERQKELADFASCSLFFDDDALTEPQTLSSPVSVINLPADTVSRIQYTSGSTGMPKGVVRTHESDNFFIDYQVWSKPGKVEIHSSIFHHARGMNQVIRNMRWGSTIVVLNKFTPKSFVDAITKYKVAVVDVAPVMHRMVMHRIEKINADVSSVNELQTSADTVTQQLVDNFNRVYNNPKFINRWAQVEVIPPFIFGSSKTFDFGFPHPDIEVKLVDGEMWYKGAGVMKEYLNAPEKTAEKFEDGWFKTNDIMRIDKDGRYWYVGRKDDSFKVSAKMVYPQEVTRVFELHPDVKQAICIPIPDKIRTNKIVVFLHMDAKERIDVIGTELVYTDKRKEMHHWFKSRDSGIEHCTPKQYIFLDEIPLIGPGKTDRMKLIGMIKK